MNRKQFTLAASLVVAAVTSPMVMAQEATTDPVGYVTHTLKAGQFNLIGLTLHESVEVTGAVEGVAGTVITDTGAFSGLTAGATYILEITSGTLAGTTQEVTTWDANTITTPQDLSGSLSNGDTFQLRKAKTIADVFGAANESGLEDGSSSTADVIWVPSGSGFEKYYYAEAAPPFLTAGWKNVSTGNTDQANAAIYYADGILVERRGASDLDLVISGAVKTNDSIVAISDEFTFVSGVFPAGSTLNGSGLQDSLQHGDTSTADIIWMPDGSGGYLKYYYATAVPPFLTAGWKRVDTGNTDQGTVEITSGVIVEKRSASPFNAKISTPSSY